MRDGGDNACASNRQMDPCTHTHTHTNSWEREKETTSTKKKKKERKTTGEKGFAYLSCVFSFLSILWNADCDCGPSPCGQRDKKRFFPNHKNTTNKQTYMVKKTTRALTERGGRVHQHFTHTTQ